MEDNGGGASPYDDIGFNNTVRKKRSLASRRPRPQGYSLFTIPAFDTNPMRKDFSLTHCISRADSQIGNTVSQGNGMINGKRADLGETKRMKLKLGGVTRLLHVNVNDTSTNNNHFEDNSDDCNSLLEKKADLEGDTWNAERDESMTGRRKQLEPSGSVRKSKRVPKKMVFDSYDDDNDEEIQFLEKLKYKNVSLCSEVTELESIPDEKETGNEVRRESTLTSRQRALASASGKSTAIEFQDGLPPTTWTRKKENISEMEQQLKKAEAAQRRKGRAEKAARTEAEAIRKILGQDSSRKKREDKNKKRLDELAQEKAAHEERVSTSYIRTIMGPDGTTVSFPIDKVPSLFDPKPSGYPPPRENCAGPACTNPYKYRDSKTKLPLCSLKCYKAVQEQQQTAPPV